MEYDDIADGENQDNDNTNNNNNGFLFFKNKYLQTVKNLV